MQINPAILYSCLLVQMSPYFTLEAMGNTTHRTGTLGLFSISFQPSPLQWVGLFLLSLCFLTLILVTIVSSKGLLFKNKNTSSDTTNHLFLKMKFIHQNKIHLPHSGYLRALSHKEATLVTPFKLPKKDEITLHLDTLPDFSHPHPKVTGTITACRPFGDQYLLQAKFAKDNKEMIGAVSKYLEVLQVQ